MVRLYTHSEYRNSAVLYVCLRAASEGGGDSPFASPAADTDCHLEQSSNEAQNILLLPTSSLEDPLLPSSSDLDDEENCSSHEETVAMDHEAPNVRVPATTDLLDEGGTNDDTLSAD